MNFTIVDTESAYRRLLNTDDSEERAAIFHEELVKPFAGLTQFFGGGGLTTFAQWGMKPDQFAEDNRPQMNSILEALAAHKAWERAAQSLEVGWNAFAAYADQITTPNITFGLYIADLGGVPVSYGYSGFGAIPGWIMTVYGAPDAYNLQFVEGATVHELHHNVFSAITHLNPMTMTLGDYMVMEGLAESFAAELYGEKVVGPYVTHFDESRLEESKAIFNRAFSRTGFAEIRGYIFGDAIAKTMNLPEAGVPDFAGYALGYRTVQAYLKQSGKSVVEATFISPQEIIEQSGFFN